DSYLPLWPNGNLRQRPSPILISSPLTGRHYSTNYQKAGLEADLPAIESTDSGGTCDNSTGAGCTLIPQTDDGVPAAFYPFYTTGMTSGGCRWTIGTHVPGFSTRDFGGHSQYGHLLSSNFTNGSGFVSAFENFRKILPHNPCPAH
ncbi:MAG: hypothetical protein ACRDP1_10465, partial [Nocardioidaceae bacterium]